VSQLLQRGLVGLALHLYPVGFPERVPGIAQPRMERAVVGEQQQAFAVVIQPAGRVDVGHGDVIGQGRPAVVGTELAQHAKRLVECQQA